MASLAHSHGHARSRRFWRFLAGVTTAVVIAGGMSAGVAAPATAGPATALEVGPRPNATRVDFPVGDRVDASVDVGTGNLLVTTTDLTLPGIDGDVQFGLDFNSLLLGPDSPLPSAAVEAAAPLAGVGTELETGTISLSVV